MDQLISSSSSTDLEAPSNHLNWVDFAVIAVYFIFVLGVGLYVSWEHFIL